MKKIYFAGSIRGGRQYAETYAYVIQGLQKAGYIVLSEHVGFDNFKEKLSDKEIYERDCAWIAESEFIVADVSQASLGVGYEIAYAEFAFKDKGICCFALNSPDVNVSAMITGSQDVLYYQDAEHFLSSVLWSLGYYDN